MSSIEYWLLKANENSVAMHKSNFQPENLSTN